MFELFASRFFQPSSGTLCEYMNDELAPLPGAKGRICEPGHHYEWIWLLRQYQRLSGRDVEPYCAALYRHADTYGWDKDGFIVDELDFSGDGHHQFAAQLAAYGRRQGEYCRRRGRAAPAATKEARNVLPV